MGRRDRLRPRCAPGSTATPSGLEWTSCPYRDTLCPQLVLAPPAGVACNGGVRVLFECARLEHGHSDLAISLAGRGLRARKWNTDNGGRPLTKSPDTFLNHVRKNKTPLTIFLVNGVKLQGVVTWFDNFCVLLRRDGHSQLVYKHAISTIMPGHPIQLFEGAEEAPVAEKV